MTKSKKNETTEIIKSQKQTKNLKWILPSSTFGENATYVVTKYNNERCEISDINIEGKSDTFKNPETKFKMNKDLSCNEKNFVYVIECSKCK